ncbi:GH36-type glycosyl hydrolase domain-containing protein [Alicyclobacillus tolerans]|uniref:Cyclic beta-1,2-glucan synthetase n=1 Tax=Alicyclobacillus tolerans TaxID=90970 RepID=A0A1M6WD04_9BACL|nr:glucoamylase family protein [Alicyclobacillus montanus]SHK91567.1 cyclic beta-1,2-glucan synthetase [Alicyclobacillus montanus]
MFENHSLQERAQTIALTHEIGRTPVLLAQRGLREFKRAMDSMRAFVQQLQQQRSECSQPAEDWLLDHFAFLEIQSDLVINHWSRQAVRHLPYLQQTGKTRIEAIASDYLQAVQGQYQIHTFLQYISAYQEVAILQIQECFMLLDALRMAAISQLSAAMREVEHRSQVCRKISDWMQKVRQSERTHEDIAQKVAEYAHSSSFTPVEIVHLTQHLNELSSNEDTVHHWLLSYVQQSSQDLQQMISIEHQFQVDLQLNSGYLVQTLHRLERECWQDIVAKICRVEILLQEHAFADYPRLDKKSQHQLLHSIRKLARKLALPEMMVTEGCLKLAENAFEAHGSEVKEASPAYYLLEPMGQHLLHQYLSQLAKPRFLPSLPLRRRPYLAYFTALGLAIALIFWIMVDLTLPSIAWRSSLWIAVVAALLIIFPASEWALEWVHTTIVKTCQPWPLLRYDFSESLPEDARTMVVMPILWSHKEDVDDVYERLLTHALANRQEHIHFAVLADFPDSQSACSEADAELLAYASERMAKIQEEYGSDRFFLFHRDRQWHASDKLYLGWERKRGKLVEFVRLLQGYEDTSFFHIQGERSVLSKIRYIFTVDHDTRLPIGAVWRLVATMHHPLHRPRLNETKTRVVSGMGVLQPRVAASYDSVFASRYAECTAAEPGLDPYAFAVSHPYQDWFGQASFVGKGLFDVEMFAQVLSKRLPENSILSHDLLEGGFLRTCLASDVEVLESQPKTIYEHERRLHRWIRGDWQLLPWFGKYVRNAEGQSEKVDLCSLTRWQMIDNLRRSMLAPAYLLLAWLATFAQTTWSWRLWVLIVVTLALPWLRTLFRLTMGRSRRKEWQMVTLRCCMDVIFLPFTVALAVDAIVRTLYRLIISHRRLLEWTPSAQVAREHKQPAFLFTKTGISLYVLLILSVTFTSWNGHFLTAGLLLFFFFASWPFERWLRQPPRAKNPLWTQEDLQTLRHWSEKIWSFYNCYVTAEENWLPPDNVQYFQGEQIAHRTSPTNIGLYLLSTVAAADLGYLTEEQLYERLSSTLATVERLPKWHGHLLNWYSTEDLRPLLPRYVSTVDSGNFVGYLMVLEEAIAERSQSNIKNNWEKLLKRVRRLIAETDFRPLFHYREQLFSIGYHLDSEKLEDTLYDLAASEARQASFIAIALGQIPASHWFVLGRTMVRVGEHNTLLSWSGTMFEYFMPSLIMRTYRGGLWDETYQGVIEKQQSYARLLGVPYGISESGYYAFDEHLSYQYRAFGVPGLAFDRGQQNELVLAPYATLLTLPFAGHSAMQALAEFSRRGMEGDFGFYEALDCTRRRLPPGSKEERIISYMAHHQGMALLAIANVLTNQKMIQRFHRHLAVRAAELLLQEKAAAKARWKQAPVLPKGVPDFQQTNDVARREFQQRPAWPEVNLLEGAGLSSMQTTAGGSWLRYRGVSITRWREFAVSEIYGSSIYLQVLNGQESLPDSPSFYPCSREFGKVCFQPDSSRFRKQMGNLESELSITIHPETPIELRRLRVFNHGDKDLRLCLTTFTELSMAEQSADLAHPAFVKLFVETRFCPEEGCLVAKKRARSAEENELYTIQALLADPSDHLSVLEFSSDRAELLKRGDTMSAPQGLNQPLSGSTGSVADPAFIFRHTIDLSAGQSATFYLVTACADTEEEAMSHIEYAKRPGALEGMFHRAWLAAEVRRRQFGLTADQVKVANLLASRLYFPLLQRHQKKWAMQNTLGQSALWSKGISGELPIVFLRISHLADMPFVISLARIQQWLIQQGCDCDLLIMDATDGGYRDELMNRLKTSLGHSGHFVEERVHVLRQSQQTEEVLRLLKSVARVHLRAEGPSLEHQLRQTEYQPIALQDQEIKDIMAHTVRPEWPAKPLHWPAEPLHSMFWNGYGGFQKGGQIYQMAVHLNRPLPRPWSMILANSHFGCLLTELGTGYTWWRNSREWKISPWSNDPLLDPPGEVIYLRDDEAGEVWSPMPKPLGGQKWFTVSYEKGRVTYTSQQSGIEQELEVTVHARLPVKMMRIRLKNTTPQVRRMSLFAVVSWVLGVQRQPFDPFYHIEWDEKRKLLLANHRYADTLKDAHAFIHACQLGENGIEENPQIYYSASLMDIYGPSGSPEQPLMICSREFLPNRLLSWPEPCGALQVCFSIASGATKELLIWIGAAESKQAALRVFDELTDSMIHNEVLPAQLSETSLFAYAAWTEKIWVNTPNAAFNTLMNGWLLYQALVCRLWARTAFYQAGGAYGFRDQIQDSLAFLQIDPSLCREQILRSAAHQYQEGDVQHWWHEETGKGIRTRFSDDLLWLPYAVLRYVETTGDQSIWQESVAFLYSPPLRDGELERYEDTCISNENASLTEHCRRALHRAWRLGEHGLPLIGIGDWNDGFSRIGAEGRGESVWLGWFLLDILSRFQRIQPYPFTEEEREEWRIKAEKLRASMEREAWDGFWYRRAFHDAGFWIGTSTATECRIDALAQSWSVISGAAEPDRQEQAMRSFLRELVDERWMLARLLTPAFNHSHPSPGYIQGYPPGLRENGGQYTHGVIWSIVALAMLGEGDQAFHLFQMLSPISHTSSSQGVWRYGNEPYVMSADVYTAPPHEGRAGWSWYTGAAGWMYQAGLEWILGVRKEGERLIIQPAVPEEWQEFSLRYTYGDSVYNIQVMLDREQTETIWEDLDSGQKSSFLTLVDDGRQHRFCVKVAVTNKKLATNAFALEQA